VRWRYRLTGLARPHGRFDGLADGPEASALQWPGRVFSEFTAEEQAWVLETIRQVALLDAEALILAAERQWRRRPERVARTDKDSLEQTRKRAATRRLLDRNRRQRQARIGILWLRVPDAVDVDRGSWRIATRPTWAPPTFDHLDHKYPGLAAFKR